jgi:hypothetical protein
MCRYSLFLTPPKHSCHTVNKLFGTVINGMKERGGKVKAMVINCTNKATLQGKIHSNIQVKSTVISDNSL